MRGREKSYPSMCTAGQLQWPPHLQARTKEKYCVSFNSLATNHGKDETTRKAPQSLQGPGMLYFCWGIAAALFIFSGGVAVFTRTVEEPLLRH